MRWDVHGERSVYSSDRLTLALADVEVPGHGRFEHHVVRLPRGAAGAVVHHPERGVLLLWRHRFITGSWGWEIPAGGIEPGEEPIAAAAREALEETGWRPLGLRPLLVSQPSSGLSDQRYHLFMSAGAEHAGEPADPAESERIEWVSVPRLRDMIRAGEMLDGLSLTALLYALAFGLLGNDSATYAT